MSLSEGFLKISQRCNNFLDFNYRKNCRPFVVGDKQVGLIPPDVFKQLKQYPSVFQVESSRHGTSSETVRLDPSLKTYEDRSKKVAKVMQQLREKDVCSSLRGWRDETFDVWHKWSEPPLLKMERTATCLFGTVQYGVHINGYTVHPRKGVCMWVGKRSKTKQTWPSKLDQMAAGGLSSGEKILECARRECQEEASVPDSVLDNLKPVGAVSYFYCDERGIFPEVQFVFDLKVPEDFEPENADGEVESFKLYPIEELKTLITQDEFKFNCAVVALDFLIRHSYITPDNEPNYTRLVENIHKTVSYDVTT